MTISYPLSLPSSYRTRMNIRPLSSVGLSSNPFNFKMQAQAFSGQILAFEITLPPMSRTDSDADEWMSFMMKLEGRYGTFMMGDNTRKQPLGAVSGSPLVNGAVARGSQTITLKSLGVSVTNVFKDGDYIQIGVRLYRILGDVNSDGSGNASLTVYPRVREALADNDSVIYNTPLGLFRLVSNESVFGLGTDQTVEISFVAAEAL